MHGVYRRCVTSRVRDFVPFFVEKAVEHGLSEPPIFDSVLPPAIPDIGG
ncbi:hypothetical protein [Rhodococcus gordoniae]